MAATLALLLLLADEPLKPKDLEGTWKGARYTEGSGDKEDNGVKLEVVIKGNVLVVKKESGVLVGEATFTLSSDGKTIDAVGTSGTYKGKNTMGILKVEKDTLTWCTTAVSGKDRKRPTAFTADPGPAHYLIVVKRQKS